MKNITLCDYKEEPHPFEIYIPEKCRFLLLGTFPAKEKDRKFQFYYSSSKNRFWEILSAVSGQELNFSSGKEAILERQKILDRLKLGLSDIGHRVLRQSESSMDINIFPIEFKDIFNLLEIHPDITRVVLTSKTKGNSALTWFKSYCKINNYRFKIPKSPYPMQMDLSISDANQITLIVLPSTSRLCPYTTEQLIELYKNCLLHK